MTRSALLLCAFFLAATIGCICQVKASTETFDVVAKTVDTPQNTVWMIEVPNVRQASTAYQQIVFAAGDHVRVLAGGCVKTGGKSPSYRQYVNPQGKGTDKYYHGLIDVPTITTGLTRIRDAGLENERVIPAKLPPNIDQANMFLTLGYEDTNYKDNGYLDHDWGPNNECYHERAAYLVVFVGHNGATTMLGTTKERISGLQQVWWANDKTGLQSFDFGNVVCVVHNPKCGAVGHNGKDAWFNDKLPSGVTVDHVDFKVFWPLGLNVTHTDRGSGASTGSYGADLKNNTVTWQNTCFTGSDLYNGNLTYQISFLITRPVGISMGPSSPDLKDFPDVCPASVIPTEQAAGHASGKCVVNCSAPPPPGDGSDTGLSKH